MADAARPASETEERREASGIFVFVGAVPHTDAVAGVVRRNAQGFILTGPDLRRSMGRYRTGTWIATRT